MIRLHISKTKQAELRQQLVSGCHRMGLRVRILNEDEQPIHSLTAPAQKITSGEVQYDVTADVSRVLNLTVVDDKGKLRMEHGSPAHGAIFINRFVAVEYKVWLPKAREWVDIPVFWGPLTGFEHNGVECQIEAMGKEVLLRDPHFIGKGFTLHKGTSLHDCIHRVASAMGNRRFRIAKTPGQRLKHPRSVSKWAEAWNLIVGKDRVAGFKQRVPPKGKKRDDDKKGEDDNASKQPSGGLVRLIKGHFEAFFDGLGRLVVRKVIGHPVYRFKWGRDFTARPNIIYDNTSFRNHVVVIGGVKKGKGKKDARAQGEAQLKPTDPLSPKRLAWHGVAQRMTHKVTADNLTDNKACRQKAQEILKHVAQQGVDAEFECFPIPMCEERDWVLIEGKGYRYKFMLRQWTLPLTSGESMSIGRKKRVRPKKRSHRRGGGHAGPPGGRGGHGRGGGGKHDGGGGRHGDGGRGGGKHGDGKHRHHSSHHSRHGGGKKK